MGFFALTLGLFLASSGTRCGGRGTSRRAQSPAWPMFAAPLLSRSIVIVQLCVPSLLLQCKTRFWFITRFQAVSVDDFTGERSSKPFFFAPKLRTRRTARGVDVKSRTLTSKCVRQTSKKEDAPPDVANFPAKFQRELVVEERSPYSASPPIFFAHIPLNSW